MKLTARSLDYPSEPVEMARLSNAAARMMQVYQEQQRNFRTCFRALIRDLYGRMVLPVEPSKKANESSFLNGESVKRLREWNRPCFTQL
jgi:hypothetical protein